MKNVAFTPVAFEEYNEWFNTSPEIIKRIKELFVILTGTLLKELVSLSH